MNPLPTQEQVIRLHQHLIAQSGGASGLRDLAALESALCQPRQVFGGAELYPDVIDKAAALGFFLISNHPFVDGNKRIGHAAMEVTLLMSGLEIRAGVEEQERVILAVAAGQMKRDVLTAWLRNVVTTRRT